MKELKDYLYLYRNANLKFATATGKNPDIKFDQDRTGVVKWFQAGMRNHFHSVGYDTFCRNYKPILRPLSDMKGDEEYYCGQITTMHSANKENQMQREAERTLWLLSRGFDLFGLIESGLALDKTKLELTNQLNK